ncbi:ribosome recycling factor [Coprothermobacteraceae bacterium]|nr:ribosome recycling factor [Coprothermobacteraceae bacterium]
MRDHELIKEAKEHFQKTIHVMQDQLSTVRASRVTPAILEPVVIEYAGSKYKITDLAMVYTQDARTIIIEPWDNSMISAISKGILKANVGANPSDDGKRIRLVFPALSQERRKELTKLVDRYLEEARVALRNIRREVIDKIKAKEKQKELSEDESKRLQAEVQKAYEQFEKQMESICEAKKKDILEE